MKVKILSGNYAGHVTEMVGSELEFNLSTGFVEPYVENPVAEPPVATPSTAPADVEPDERAAADNPVDDTIE